MPARTAPENKPFAVFLRHTAGMQHWSPSATARLADAASRHTVYSALPVLPEAREARDILMVAEGSVEVVHLSADGELRTQALVHAGAMLGLASCFHARRPAQDWLAHTPSVQVWRIPRAEFVTAMQLDTAMTASVLSALAQRTHWLLDETLRATLTPTRRRVAAALLSLSGVEGGRGTRAIETLAIKQVRLATLAGTTRQGVRVALDDLTALGLLRCGRQSIQIVGRERLAALVAARD